jgi:FkbM family methyltransferase
MRPLDAFKRTSASNLIRPWFQALAIARSLDEPTRFLKDVAVNAPLGAYGVSATGQRVHLRPRGDLQVAREYISHGGYDAIGDVSDIVTLGPRPRVVDVGANIGLFTMAAARTFGPAATVLAVEPDPQNLDLLRANVRDNGLGDRVDVLAAAAGTAQGTLRFASGHKHISRAADLADDAAGGDRIEVAAADFYDVASDAEIVKLDIEGGEWPILRDDRLAQLPAVALLMEWHTRGSGVEDAHGEAVSLLAAAGYRIAFDDNAGPVAGGALGHRVGSLVAVRPS